MAFGSDEESSAPPINLRRAVLNRHIRSSLMAARVKSLFQKAIWLYRHYPRVPEGRDGFLLKIYDRWSVKLTSGGRGAIGALFLLSLTEMLPRLSPIFPILLLLLTLLLIDFIRGARSLQGELQPERQWRAYPGEEKEWRVNWRTASRGGLFAPRIARLPDGVQLLSSPDYSDAKEGSSTFTLRAVRRGVWRLDHLRLAQEGGLRLIDRWSPATSGIAMIVHPRPLPVSTIEPLQRALHSFLYAPLTSTLQLSSHGEFRSLRPYIVGDPLKLIHPRSSARLGKPMVRINEEATSWGEEITIAIDLRIDSLQERLAFEAMISLAAGWAISLILKEYPVSLLYLHRSGEWQIPLSKATLESEVLLDSLAELHAEWSRRKEKPTALPPPPEKNRGWLISTSSQRCGTLPRGWRGAELYLDAPSPKAKKGRKARFTSSSGWSRFEISSWEVSDR